MAEIEIVSPTHLNLRGRITAEDVNDVGSHLRGYLDGSPANRRRLTLDMTRVDEVGWKPRRVFAMSERLLVAYESTSIDMIMSALHRDLIEIPAKIIDGLRLVFTETKTLDPADETDHPPLHAREDVDGARGHMAQAPAAPHDDQVSETPTASTADSVARESTKESSPHSTEWTSEKSHRRSTLVDKKIDATLSQEEQLELDELQRQMLTYRRRLAPLPIKKLREMHELLLQELQETKNNT